jgi:thiol-disulfide isomerase/thioredoxin
MDDTPQLDQEPTAPPQRTSRRWPLGLLTLLVVAVIAGGVLLFDDPAEDTPDIPDLSSQITGGVPDGEAAPDFALDLIDGTPFRLSDHLADDGRPVILNLWASWCGPCRAEMPAFDIASQTHTDVFFIGVAVEDDPDNARAFAEEIGVGYALAIDDAERVARRYFSPGLPATFFISADGIIVRKAFGQLDEADLAQVIAESFGL